MEPESAAGRTYLPGFGSGAVVLPGLTEFDSMEPGLLEPGLTEFGSTDSG